MPLILMDGFDDRLDANDQWGEGDETYTGWGLYTEVQDGVDYGVQYNGIRSEETRYGVGKAFCAPVNHANEAYDEAYTLIKKNIDTSHHYYYFGMATNGMRGDIAQFNGAGLTVTVYRTGFIVVRKQVASFTWQFVAWTYAHLATTWPRFYIEVYCAVGLGAGNDFIKIWVNGELVMDKSALNLLPYLASLSYIEFPAFSAHADDVFLYTSTSAITPHGEVIIPAMKPNGAGTNSDFTPSAGSNYQNVDEDQQDHDTSYNSSDGTSGHRDDFTIESLSSQVDSSSTVKAVSVRVMASASASEQIRPYIDIGGTRYYGTAFSPPSTSYAYTEYIWELNPSTSSPWTVAQVDAIKVGYEVV